MEPNRNQTRRVKNTPSDSGRMWPLDTAAIALGGLVLFLIVTQLRFDDPRLLYNAKTYLIAVPCISLGLALVLRTLVSRYLQKSAQLGFLFSVSVHLLLLIVAINYVVFAAYRPIASKGQKMERTPIHKTVPEHVFQTPKESNETPDWSKPIEAETKSRVVPKEQRQLPPVERSKPRLEVPKPKPTEMPLMQKFLMERKQANAAKPMPADSPSKLARRESTQAEPTMKSAPIETPAESRQAESPIQAAARERQINDAASARAARMAPSRLEQASVSPQADPVVVPTRPQQAAASRSFDQQLPTIGDAGMARDRRARSISRPAAVAGAAPAPVKVAVAMESNDASMTLSPTDVTADRTGEAVGAQITSGDSPSFMVQSPQPTPMGGAMIARDQMMAAVGAPQVNAGTSDRAPGRARRMNVTRGVEPIGSISPVDSIPASSNGQSGEASVGQVDDRLGESDSIAMRTGGGGERSMELTPPGAPSFPTEFMAEIGPTGIGDRPAPVAGLMPMESKPDVAVFELPREARPRRQVGGPATPAGTQVAAVESFSKRMMRTSGGPASSAPGTGGPATEEAIELGLAYLASVQNEDGSWSLQGHGERVMLRSDTAATGLCLLAFQGAGYTHKQHQYAEAVGNGIKFLLENQRTSGNLYRSEDPVSDRNVMFYSHGIASLALCEAFGMTQDPELRSGAQGALNYIMDTQHRERGGWRYTPQVSSDTSVTGWMMMALKSGDLAGLSVRQDAYDGIDKWLSLASEGDGQLDRYRYNPYAPDTPQQRHGRVPTPTMTAVGMLMRMYNGWRRERPAMQSAADYLLDHLPQLGERNQYLRDGYYWYYATQFMFHMGGKHWDQWSRALNPLLLRTQIKDGPDAGSWHPTQPVPDRWSTQAGRLYVTTMNLLNLEVYYRHLPIYEDVAAE